MLLKETPKMENVIRHQTHVVVLASSFPWSYQPTPTVIRYFHRSYISELRVELYRHLFQDGFRQRMVLTGKQLTISGWKNYHHIPSIYLIASLTLFTLLKE